MLEKLTEVTRGTIDDRLPGRVPGVSLSRVVSRQTGVARRDRWWVGA